MVPVTRFFSTSHLCFQLSCLDIPDKFDQFWSVNKKLMESGVGEGFRNIPMRCYTGEKFALQRLIRPLDETTGTWTTLEEALQDFAPHFHPTSRESIKKS